MNFTFKTLFSKVYSNFKTPFFCPSDNLRDDHPLFSITYDRGLYQFNYLSESNL